MFNKEEVYLNVETWTLQRYVGEFLDFHEFFDIEQKVEYYYTNNECETCFGSYQGV